MALTEVLVITEFFSPISTILFRAANIAMISGVVDDVLSVHTLVLFKIEFSQKMIAEIATLLDLDCINEPSVAINGILDSLVSILTAMVLVPFFPV